MNTPWQIGIVVALCVLASFNGCDMTVGEVAQIASDPTKTTNRSVLDSLNDEYWLYDARFHDAASKFDSAVICGGNAKDRRRFLVDMLRAHERTKAIYAEMQKR